MKKDNKKQLYESIMKNIQKELIKVLNEEKEMSPSEKMDAWHNGERKENISACSADKLKKYKAICQAKKYDAEVAAIDAEIKKRGLKESKVFKDESIVPNQYGEDFANLVLRVLDDSASIDPNTDSEIIFDALVPGMGSAETLGGELMRATMRIAYRYYNDGDWAGEGYGRETVNPAVRFLDAQVKPSPLREVVNKFMNFVDKGYTFGITDKEYERLVQKLLAETVHYIVVNKLWNVPNDDDMFDYKNDKLDVDRGDDWEDGDW